MILPIYPARETPIPGVSAGLVAAAARRLGHGRVVEAPPPVRSRGKSTW